MKIVIKWGIQKKYKVICEEGATEPTEDVYFMEMVVAGDLLRNEKVTVVRLD